MPDFSIRVVNQHFSACNIHDLANADDARAEAIKGALQIGTAEVCEGSPLFGAEVSVESEGERIGHFVVTIGVSALK